MTHDLWPSTYDQIMKVCLWRQQEVASTNTNVVCVTSIPAQTMFAVNIRFLPPSEFRERTSFQIEPTVEHRQTQLHHSIVIFEESINTFKTENHGDTH